MNQKQVKQQQQNRYGKRDTKERYEHNVLIKPITTFPEFHPVVKNRVCDKFKQGDRIPGTKLASQELQKDPKGFNPSTREVNNFYLHTLLS